MLKIFILLVGTLQVLAAQQTEATSETTHQSVVAETKTTTSNRSPQLIQSVNPSPLKVQLEQQQSSQQQQVSAMTSTEASLAEENLLVGQPKQRIREQQQLELETTSPFTTTTTTTTSNTISSVIVSDYQHELPRHSSAGRTIHLDKRSWFPSHERRAQSQLKQQAADRRREEVMNLLLRELPNLDIEVLKRPSSSSGNSGSSLKNTQSAGSDADSSTQQQSTESYQAVLPNTGNRLRGRSAFVVGAMISPSNNNQVSAYHQISAVGMEKGVSGFPKRVVPIRPHVPCFFNAITCF